MCIYEIKDDEDEDEIAGLKTKPTLKLADGLPNFKPIEVKVMIYVIRVSNRNSIQGLWTCDLKKMVAFFFRKSRVALAIHLSSLIFRILIHLFIFCTRFCQSIDSSSCIPLIQIK